MAAASGAETQAVLDELSNEIDRLNKENAALRQRVQFLTHRLFGRRSEKGVPVVEQGVLPFEPVNGNGNGRHEGKGEEAVPLEPASVGAN